MDLSPISAAPVLPQEIALKEIRQPVSFPAKKKGEDYKDYVSFVHPDAPCNGEVIAAIDFQKDCLPSSASLKENSGKKKYYQRPVRKFTPTQVKFLLERSKLHKKTIQTRTGIQEVNVSDWIHIIEVEKYDSKNIVSRKEEWRVVAEGKDQEKQFSEEMLNKQIEEIFESKIAEKLENLGKK